MRFLAVLLLVLGITMKAHADEEASKLTLVTNGLPGICGPYYTNQVTYPGRLITPSGELISTPRSGGFMRWQSMDATNFRQENPDKFQAFSDAGLLFGVDYKVYKPYGVFDFFGDGVWKPVYLIGYKAQQDGQQKPAEIIIPDDGSTLAGGLKQLGPSDIVTQGLHAYPIVVRPDRIVVYEIDSDMTSRPEWNKKPFIPTVVCDFTIGNGAETAGVAPSANAVTPSQAAPTTTTTGNPPAAPYDPCGQYLVSNQAYFPTCEANRQNMLAPKTPVGTKTK